MSRLIRIRATVEPLEGRALLSGLAVTVTTDQPSYQVGQPINITLTETNTTDHDMTVAEGCGVNDLWATQNGAELWRKSKDGPQPLCPIFLGGVLHAHESRSFGALWDGHTDEGPPGTPTGVVEVFGGVDGVSSPPVAIRIEPPAATNHLVLTVTTDHELYRPGRRVQITVTETNTGNEPVAVGFAGPKITISRRGVVVWRLHSQVHPQAARLLQPGQTQQFAVAWKGLPNVPVVRLRPDIYTVQVALDGMDNAATIRIGRR
jgi:hypothetical protein